MILSLVFSIMVVNLNFFHVLPVYNGDNLYPFLFSIFLNDLEDFFQTIRWRTT